MDNSIKPHTVEKYTFRSLLEKIEVSYKERVAYSTYLDENGNITYFELKERAEKISSYLISLGLNKEDKVAIFSPSSPNWMVAYLGIVNISLVAVPILSDFSSRESSAILEESNVSVIFTNDKNYKKIEETTQKKAIKVIDIFSLVPYGEEECILSTSINKNEIKKRTPEEGTIASLIFTSGTTGRSKGVVLTHKNLIYSADEASLPYMKIKKGYRVLSILPMSHVYEFTLGHVLPLMMGCHITVLCKTPSSAILLPAFKRVKPHIVMTVPLIIEKIYKSFVKPILENSKIKVLTKTKLGKRVVYSFIVRKLLSYLGGEVKFFGIGGAPLDKETEEFLYYGSFPYALGYGLTETSPLISACGPKRRQHSLNKIGKLVKGLDVKILEPNSSGIGEIVLKGPSVMSGYYNNDKLNSQSFTNDGYFKTGDLGCIDEHGFIAIRGRSKTMILSSSGENIYPEEIEELINKRKYVEESLVVEHSGSLTALIKLDLNALKDKLKIAKEDVLTEAKKYLEEIKKEVNNELSSFSRISDVVIQEKSFERTPTMKIKRFLY